MVGEQGIPHVFLGVQRPALVSAVEYVLPRYGRGKTLNLNGLVVVVPGARAGRRFRELLLERVAQSDLRVLPPEVVTAGRLPELLYRPQKPFASDWVQQQAWADAVRSAPADIRAHVLPRAAVAAGGQSDWTTGDWLAAGRLLQRQYRELAAEGFSFDDVACEGAKLPRFPERERWEAMGAIQQRYLALLDQLELWDRQTARLVAVKQRECRLDRDVLLLGTVDLGRNLRQMLDQVAARVTALIYAPPQWQTRFDAHGCVDVGAWERAQLEVDTTRLAIVDKPVDQAMAAADYVAGQADRFTVDEVTIGCADERLVSPVQRALVRRGAPARWGPGRPLAESLPYRLLDAMRLWLAVDDAAAFASLARHPDIVTWLNAQGIRNSWLRELDQFRSEHVPLRITPQTVRSPRSELARAVSMLADLRRPLEGPAASPAVWSERIVSLLQIVYGQRTFDRDAPADRMTLRGCLRLREFLAEQMSVPSRLAVACTAEEALHIVLQQLRTERVAAATDPEAMEILGWLELPLDDAPLLVVAGLNEGVVPKSVTADLFLPDRLRKHLEIDDNRRRYARDAYALSVLLASCRELYLVAGRHDEDDTPLFPSRLLFAADDAEVARRWHWYFEQAAESALPMPVLAAAGPDQKFAFTIPRPDRSGDQLQRLRVTHFRSYLACPYRFYLEHVLKLKTVTDDVSELEAREFGNVMHAALDAFGRGPAKDSTDPEEIYAALEKALNRTIKERCGAAMPAAIQIQIKQMQMRLNAFARRQAEHAASGWRIEFVEVPERDVHAVITVPEGSMNITGRIDRIDRHVESGARAIWDYKTGESGKDPRAAHQSQGRWVDLQLPLYINLARAMDVVGPLTLGYINLSQRTDEIAFVLADWSAEELASAEREAENVVRKILRREFWPPADPPPKYSEDWAALCLDGVMERQSSPSWEAPLIQGELF